MPDDDRQHDEDQLRAETARKMKDMPAETALGNRDPEGGGVGTPEDYEREHG